MDMTKQQERLMNPIWDYLEKTDSYEWKDIKELVDATKEKITNWLNVRDLMQAINEELGFIRDTKNLSIELYIRS